ncbi:AAA family ATPase [Pseudoduganella sp. FT25W]|uniref:AAA family ATPase n=1 Tax=Duganella alba TaxID=2666081 RepID=A0A6L5QB77_9BURK|nr:ATP-binding protein [Duganella alba]MRX06967.1 AAA family ATPase [Duganella alba]MRX16136.1 AAA family ATPase [Duganella alba]
MIEQITVKNFKSLADVTIDFGKFNCFVGLNGAGKTTILQALDFIAQQMRGNVSDWLDERGWSGEDLLFHGGVNPGLNSGTVEVRFRLQSGDLLSWTASFSSTRLQLMDEVAVLMSAPSEQLLSTSAEHFTLDGVMLDIAFNYEGSMLSQFRDKLLPEPLLELKTALINMRSLYLLAPHLLRRNSRLTDHSGLSAGGDGLPAFLDKIQGSSKERLEKMLRVFYPNITGFTVVTMPMGSRRLMISEQLTQQGVDGKQTLIMHASHVNDGLLRVLAILAQLEYDSTNILVLDEIENGINPEITEKLVDLLVQCPAQIIVTTHSPMILNYMADDIAKTAVKFVFKDTSGRTDVQPFFSLPATAEKLAYMGPGEAFVDTNLNRLTETFLQAKKASMPVQP